MDIDDEKRKAIRMILTGQDEIPVTLTTAPIGHDTSGTIHYDPNVDSSNQKVYNESNKGSNMTTDHAHEDTTDYKEMAAFFQTRIGEIQKGHEADLYFMQSEINRLTVALNDATQDDKSNVVE